MDYSLTIKLYLKFSLILLFSTILFIFFQVSANTSNSLSKENTTLNQNTSMPDNNVTHQPVAFDNFMDFEDSACNVYFYSLLSNLFYCKNIGVMNKCTFETKSEQKVNV